MEIMKLKSTTEMKNILEGLNRFKLTEERISKLEDQQKQCNPKNKEKKD